MSNKLIINAAITGAIHIPTQSEYLPITPEEIAKEAIEAYKAGASIAHIHVRNPKDGSPTPDVELFKEVCEKVLQRPDSSDPVSTDRGCQSSVSTSAQ